MRANAGRKSLFCRHLPNFARNSQTCTQIEYRRALGQIIHNVIHFYPKDYAKSVPRHLHSKQAGGISSAIEPGGPSQMMDRRVVVGGLAGVVMAFSCVAAAADEWPERPVRIVVPFSAAGAADTFGRFYADVLSNAFGKQFYVENKVGAGGMIGPRRSRAQNPTAIRWSSPASRP